MGAIKYLYLHTLKNKTKQALRKPITYFYIGLIVFYMTLVPLGFGEMAGDLGVANPFGMAGIFTAIGFWLVPGNIIAYAKRKGLVFRSSDVHFMFPCPISPKLILLYAHIRNLFMQILVTVFAVVCGGVVFKVALWKLAIYAVFALVVENIFEACTMMLIYGTEKLGEKQLDWIRKGAYALVGALVVIGFVYYLREGLSMQTVKNYLHSEAIQMVPVVGWYTSVIHLLFVGPSAINIAGTAAYVLMTIIVLIMAIRMKCSGNYFEDAMKFADDYEELLDKRKQGNNETRLGKKQKFGKATVTWKGSGAKAIYYRQLLEYKKTRFFIFDITSLFFLLAGIGIAILYVREGGFGDITEYVIPLASGYLVFVFTALNGKWARELKSPYTYLIPGSDFAKLWNATKIQVLQSFLNAVVITLPGAIVMKLGPWVTVFCIIFTTLVAANKLYVLAVAEIVTGNALGNVGKQFFQMLVQGFVLGFAVLGAVVGHYIGGLELSYAIMDIVLLVITALFMVLASLNFYRMEAA